MKHPIFKSKKAGSSLSLTMMFFTVIGMVTITAVGVTTTNDAMAQRAVEKTQATALAESGVQMLYDQICRDHAALQTPSQTKAQSNLQTTFAGRDRTQGSYAARVLDVQTTKISPAPGYGAGSVKYTHVYTLEGTGTAFNGTTSITQAKFTVTRVLNGEVSEGGGATLVDFPGAINSNTTIEFQTNQGIRTQDPSSSDKSAHIVANDGIIWRPASGTKETYVNPNIIDIQGFILVANQPEAYPFDMTKGIAGLGNPNGTKNYRSAAAHSVPSPDYTVLKDEVTGMGQEKHYPDLSELALMKSALLQKASTSSGTQTYSSINSSSVPFHPSLGRKFIDAPAVITGNFNVASGDQINLRPTSSNPDENVIYVQGNVSNLGQIANLGVKLVILGQYTDSTSATYNLDTQNSLYSDLKEVYKHAAMVSFNQRRDAIKIISNSTARYGNVYAAAGGIEVTGNLEINGVLTSGGPVEYTKQQLWLDPSNTLTGGSPVYGGGVKIAPVNGQSFAINFIREARSFSVGGSGSTQPLALLEPIAADRLTDWRRLR